MLAKINRLHTDQGIKRLTQTGKTFFLPQLTIKYLAVPNKELKVGFVVSTKIDKRATVRNKLKRRLREATRAILPRLKPGYFILIIAKKAALELDLGSLKKQLIFALSQARIYNGKNT